MDPVLIAMLVRLLGLTEEEVAGLSLEEIDAKLIEAAEVVGADVQAEGAITALTEIREAAAQVRTLAEELAAEEARLATEAAELLTAIRGETPPPEGEPEETPAEGDPTTPAEPAPTEPEPETASPDGAVEVPVAIAAAAPPADETDTPTEAAVRRASPMPRPVARLRPRSADAAPPARDEAPYALLASSGDPDSPRSGHYNDLDEVGMAMLRRWEHSGPANGIENVPVGQMNWIDRYPEERILEGMSAGQDSAKIRRVMSAMMRGEEDAPALVAAGGYCAPVAPRYEQAVISVGDRPVRDALMQFAAPRGGVTFTTPPTLNDALAGANQQTLAADVANTAKTCLTVTCGSAVTVQTYAMVRCLQFGNFNARTYPENVAAFSELVMAAWARKAERALLTRLTALSVNVSTGQILGAIRDVLVDLERAAVAYRSRNRMRIDAPLRVILPGSLLGALRADLTRQLPGDDELDTANEEITGFFRTRNLNVTWALDGETSATAGFSQDYGAQAAGALNPWIESIVWYMFHEGAFLFLDGGVLDLGIVRDSTLNLRNNFQTFAESFEEVAFVGVEALRGRSTICVNGATAATASTAALCTSGS